MVTTLGLKGIHYLLVADKAVPKQLSHRMQLITNIFNYCVPSCHLTTEQCVRLIEILNQTSLAHIRKCDEDTLRDFTMDTGQPTIFLVPPVTTCINGSCLLSGNDNSLLPHHSPLTVILFTLEGPMPGIKQSLKCKSCGYIYNYSMYGHKHAEGERMYNEERNFIEVTDTVFCHRNVHQLFCNLRYVAT